MIKEKEKNKQQIYNEDQGRHLGGGQGVHLHTLIFFHLQLLA
jgi:hypothetical protein